MRENDLLEERFIIPNISDEERLGLITFIIEWLGGTYMRTQEVPFEKWDRIAELFPPHTVKPKRLMRVVTLPIRFADMKHFHLPKPALMKYASWTSTHFGLESVAGIAVDVDEEKPDTCRIAIGATIRPEDVMATHRSLKKAFLSLAADWDYDSHGEPKDGVYPEYLGRNDIEVINHDLGYYLGLFDDIKGGPLRQYEHIVRTTPLDVKNLRVYRRGKEHFYGGHDDPHNSGNYRGWFDQ